MTIDDTIRDEKLQYNINRELKKNQHYHQEKLPSDQRRVKEQRKFSYSPLGKALEKQTKTIEEQGKKQTDPIANQPKD